MEDIALKTLVAFLSLSVAAFPQPPAPGTIALRDVRKICVEKMPNDLDRIHQG